MKQILIVFYLIASLVMAEAQIGTSTGTFYGNLVFNYAGGGGGGGGGASATDNFTRADASPISSPMSDGIGTWTSPVGASSTIRIVSNSARGVNAGQANMARIATPTFGNDQTNTVTAGSSTAAYGAGVRGDASGHGYMVATVSSVLLEIDKVAVSGGAYAGSTLTNHAYVGIGTGFTISLAAVGTTLTCYTNGVACFNCTDSTYSGGQPFIYTSGNSVPTTLMTATSN